MNQIFFKWMILLFVFHARVMAEASFDESQPIKVGLFECGPLCCTSNAPHYDGLFVDIIDDIAQKEGWKISFVKGSVAEGLKRLETGEIDILLATPYSKSSLDQYDFSKETVVSTWAQIYAVRGIDIRSVQDLEGLSIALVGNDPFNASMRSIIAQFNIKCKFVEVNDYRNVFRAIEKKWVDAGMVDRFFGVMEQGRFDVKQTSVVFSPIELRFAALKGKRANLLSVIDFHLKQLKEDPRSIYHLMYEKILIRDKTPKGLFLLKWISGIALILLAMSFFIGMVMRRQIRLKTHLLLEQNLRLEQEVAMRRDAQKALGESKQLYKSIFQSTGAAMVIIDKELNIHKMNRNAESLFSANCHDTVEKRKITEFFMADEFTTFINDYRNADRQDAKKASEAELKIQSPDNRRIDVLVKVSDIPETTRAIITIIDITRENTLEEQLRQAQKMEAIGTLAGGIAHDFNNILAAIMGYAELTLMGPLDKNTTRKLKNILAASERAKELINQILMFSRKAINEKKPTFICPLINEALKLLRASIPATIEIKKQIRGYQTVILADPTQIHQVLMNLCTNAVQSMANGRGVMTISLDEITINEEDMHRNLEFRPGSYAQLTVSDTGKGICENVLPRIFDPFFTTKKRGKGTGMGLSVVHGIVKDHDGVITVSSEPEMGTTFCVYLPTIECPIQKTIPGSRASYKGYGTLLFVDDEPAIVDMTTEMLKRLNYDVISTTNSTAALSFFKENQDKIRCVITDLTMPDLTGWELADEIRKICPGTPIVMASGNCEVAACENENESNITAHIRKPFSRSQLSELLCRILNAENKFL